MGQPDDDVRHAPLDTRPGPPQQTTPVPLTIRSSVAFLHHLHTDPSSHHITLSGNVSRDSLPGAQNVPRTPNTPLELDESGDAIQSAERHPVRVSTAPVEGVAGPSSPRSLSRSNSKRRRPGSSASDSEIMPGSGIHSRMTSAELDTALAVDDIDDDDLPQITAEEGQDGMDSCIAQFVHGDEGAAEAMTMLSLASTHTSSSGSHEAPSFRPGSAAGSDTMSDPLRKVPRVSTSPSSGSQVVGRAGSFAAQASSATSALPPARTSPIEQLSWSTFARSYAHGLFDPNRIPNPPNALAEQPRDPLSVHSSPGRQPTAMFGAQSTEALGSHTGSGSVSSHQGTTSVKSGSSPPTTVSSNTPSSSGSLPSAAASLLNKRSMSGVMDERKKAFEFETLPPLKQDTTRAPRPDKLGLPSYNFAAATVRMASSNLRPSDFLPLGVPSPERELLDPMASVVSPSAQPLQKSSPSSDPGNSRLSLTRSISTAYGAPSDHGSLLPTIAASPVGTPNELPVRSKGKIAEAGRDPNYLLHRGGHIPHHIPAASVPLERTVETPETDYFGNVDSPPRFDRHHSYVSQSSSSKTGNTVTATPTPQAKTKNVEQAPKSLPATPPGPPQPASVGQMYEALGWLPAPMPPQEHERRKALYRYNILHTSPDINFDRIAHMTKLVFSPKIVLITLIDADEQVFKAESGLGMHRTPRLSSFCSHSILAT